MDCPFCEVPLLYDHQESFYVCQVCGRQFDDEFINSRRANLKKKNKYGSKKIEVDGYMFDSKKEAKMYEQLRDMQKVGMIKDLELQPEFLLQKKFRNFDGDKIREIKYYADFMFFDCEQDRWRVVDCKGYKTKVFRIKRKLFDFIYRDEYALEEEV